MKTCRSLLWLPALALAALSCAKDTPAAPEDAAGHRVTIRASASGAPDASTRADTNLQVAGYTLRYILEVWTDGEDSEVAHREQVLTADASQEVVFDFSLPEAGTYRALLWADYIPAGSERDHFYRTNSGNGLKNVSLVKNAYTVSNPARDAFYGGTTIEKTDGEPAEVAAVSMRRPFGRINVAEKDPAALAALETLDLSYAVPESFDVASGEIGERWTVDINDLAAPPPATEQKANLFYDYLFAPSFGQYLLDEITIDYTIHDDDSRFVVPAGVPIEQNRRTNVSGAMLVDRTAVGIAVEVADDWVGTDNTSEIGPDISPLAYYYEGGVVSSRYTDERVCLGLVFHFSDESGEHGLMMSLDECHDDSMYWGFDYNEEMDDLLLVGADDENDGTNNLQTLLEAKNNDLNLYPAFAWCVEKGGGWYLPAINEVAMLHQARDADPEAFDDALTAAGGVPIGETEPFGVNNYFLSSSEDGSTYVWVWDFIGNERISESKTAPHRIRAVRRF